MSAENQTTLMAAIDSPEAMPSPRDIAADRISPAAAPAHMAQPDITVWIPTCKRPALLKTALTSVSKQSAKAAIREVVVFENGLDRNSEAVCKGFGDLPITYIFRDVPLEPGSVESVVSAEEWLGSLDTTYIALLFDDDWWAPNHLERAMEGFREVPDAVASFCSFLITAGETRYVSDVFGSFVPWFASGGRQVSGRWVLTLPDLIVAGLMAVPVHYSSMVVRRKDYLACLPALKDGNPCDNDRAISVELASRGRILCDATPTAFVRIHEGQEHKRLTDSGATHYWHLHTTRQIVNRANKNGMDIREEFAARLKATGASMDQVEANCIHDSFDFLVQNGFVDATWSDKIPVLKALKRGLRNVTPPILWNLGKESRQLVSSLMGRSR